MSKVTVYTYKNCDTCRRATKWLRRQGIPFEERPIRATPPSLKELQLMLDTLQGERGRLFNTSGLDYRALKLRETLPDMADADALLLLAANGNLVKRPFLLGDGVGLTGFDESEWAAALAGS